MYVSGVTFGIGETDGGDAGTTLPQLPNGGGFPSERYRAVDMVRNVGT